MRKTGEYTVPSPALQKLFDEESKKFLEQRAQEGRQIPHLIQKRMMKSKILSPENILNAATYMRNTKLYQAALDEGADINDLGEFRNISRNERYNTMLSWQVAIKIGSVEMLSYADKRGADIKGALDIEGVLNPIELASHEGHAGILKYLKENYRVDLNEFRSGIVKKPISHILIDEIHHIKEPVETIKSFEEIGIKFDVKDKYKNPILHNLYDTQLSHHIFSVQNANEMMELQTKDNLRDDLVSDYALYPSRDKKKGMDTLNYLAENYPKTLKEKDDDGHNIFEHVVLETARSIKVHGISENKIIKEQRKKIGLESLGVLLPKSKGINLKKASAIAETNGLTEMRNLIEGYRDKTKDKEKSNFFSLFQK